MDVDTYAVTNSKSLGASRLGLAEYTWWSEALHGVAGSPGVSFGARGQPYGYATSFPQPILMSAAFDDDLIGKVANIIGNEARAFANGGRASVDFWVRYHTWLLPNRTRAGG